MKVWIDGQCLQTSSRFRGIGRYLTELIVALDSACEDVELHISFNAAIADEAISATNFISSWIDKHNIHIWHGAVNCGEIFFFTLLSYV